MKNFQPIIKNWLKVFLGGIPLTTLIFLFRFLGWLSPLELAVYDLFFQLRPLEAKDERIVIVGLEEKDISKYYPLTDSTLANLLTKIKEQQPAYIGLDFYRDVSVGDGSQELRGVFENSSTLYGLEKISGSPEEQIPAPEILKQKGQTASAAVVVDSDGVLRRGFITPIADGKTNLYSLGATLGILYLMAQGFEPQDSVDGRSMQIGSVVFRSFEKDDGGYQNADSGGYQILVNYRNPQQSFEFRSFSEVLNEEIEPDLFTNRLVLIGSTALSIKDAFFTPFSRSFNAAPSPQYGVEIQAYLASHLISSVLDGRPTIKTLPNFAEYLTVIFWGSLTGFLLWRLRLSQNYLRLSLNWVGLTLLLIGFLIAGSYVAFLEGWWIPIISSALEIIGMALVIIGLILVDKNQQLNRLLQQLQLAQEQIIEEKKQSEIARFIRGITHEINNPLSFINNFAQLSLEAVLKLKEEQENPLEQSSSESQQKLTEKIEANLVDLVAQSNKATKITKSLLLQAHPKIRQPVLTNINDLIEANLQIVTYSKQAEKGDFSLYVETEYELRIGQQLIIAGDLNQIVVNLLHNACDAVFEKKDRVGSEFEPTILVTTNLLENQWIEIAVIDNGDGIPPEIAQHIFEPFNTSKQPGEGTGLGLYIVDDLAKQNQWEIHWIREEEKTRFVVKLPIN